MGNAAAVPPHPRAGVPHPPAAICDRSVRILLDGQTVMEGRYNIPRSVRYHSAFVWAMFCLIATFAVLGTRYGWFQDVIGVPVWRAALMMAAFGLFLLTIQIRWWLVEAPRYVNAVEWDDREVVLFPARGGAVSLQWCDIGHARVPPDPGGLMHGYYAATSTAASLFVTGRVLPYKLPLSFAPECIAFLETLERHTQVTHEEPGKRRR